MLLFVHENSRCSVAPIGFPRGSASQGHSGDSGWKKTGGSCETFRGYAPGGWKMGQEVSGRRPWSTSSPTKGETPRRTLQSWQAAQIARTVVDRYPEQLKLPFYLWTREAVAELIKQRFGITLSIWRVGRYLGRWGFTPQKPTRQAFEQDPEQVRQWLEEKYPEIRRLARRRKAEIYWGDEMGLRSDHACGRSYGRCGETPVIPGRASGLGVIWFRPLRIADDCIS